MSIKKSVFGSKPEKELFKTLQSHWSERFDLYPNLPFSRIISFDNSGLYQHEQDYLYDTSIDYTLCTKKDKPLISVEFDGMCHGFSRSGEFVEVVKNIRGKNRKWKMDLKLRVANENNYPFIIVSYEEKEPIGRETTLTVVDGLIGQVLAFKYFQNKVEEVLTLYEDDYKDLPENQKQEYIDDLVLWVEVETGLKLNPIDKAANDLMCVCQDQGIFGRWAYQHLYDPELPDGNPLVDRSLLRKRADAIEKAERVGCRYTVYTDDGERSEEVWIRNFTGIPGVSVLSLTENIAGLILFNKLLAKSNAEVSPQPKI